MFSVSLDGSIGSEILTTFERIDYQDTVPIRNWEETYNCCNRERLSFDVAFVGTLPPSLGTPTPGLDERSPLLTTLFAFQNVLAGTNQFDAVLVILRIGLFLFWSSSG
jgi:hypothetical protein